MLHRVCPTGGQVQPAEFGIQLLEVGYGRHDPGLQGLDRDDILDTRTHGVAREPLGIRDDDAIGVSTEHPAQRVDLRRRTATSGRRIRLVRHEDGGCGDRVAVRTVCLRLPNDRLHDLTDVLDVQARAVEGAVGRDGPEHLADRQQAAFPRGARGFDDHGRGARPHDHPVPAPVERGRGILDDIIRRRRATGQESRSDPRQQGLPRGVVGGHHDDPFASPCADPVLGQRHRLRRARTRGVHVRVRAPRPDDLRELRMAHRQAAEQESPVERVGLCLEQVA